MPLPTSLANSIHIATRLWPILCALCFAGVCVGCKNDRPANDNPPPSSAAELAKPANNGQSPAPVASQRMAMTDVTSTSGIDFSHFYDGQGGYYMAEPIASGISSFDFDNDGRVDIYFLTGHTLPEPSAQDPTNQLFRNLGNFHFQKVPTPKHDAVIRFSVGAASADFNNDGFEDLFVNNVGKNSLYLNLGDGTFEEVGASSGVPQDARCGAGVAFSDFNRDGNLDLFVANYVTAPIAQNTPRTTDGFRSYPGPLDFEPDSDAILLSNGDGTFHDASELSGILAFPSTSMGLVCWDFDNDNDQDVLVVNDVDANTLLQNDGSARFTNVSIDYGIAFSYDAQRNGNMGADLGDFNRDGLLDVFSTTYSNDLPVLYEATAEHMFLEVAVRQKAGTQLGPHANWGTVFADFDLDGDEDLFIANGHTDPSVGKWAFNTSWKVQNTLLENNNGTFREVSKAGSGLLPVESSRGICVEDFDNDGDSDIVVQNALAQPTVIRNDTPHNGKSIRVRLIAPSGIRDSTGAELTAVFLDGKQSVQACLSGRSYQSGYGREHLFASTESNPIVQFNVKWPDGEITHHQANDSLNSIVIFRDGPGN